MRKLLLIFLVIFLGGCKLTSSDKEPLFEKDTSNEAERENTLFVFVGEKISAEMQPADSLAIDGRMVARYKILQRVYGDYQPDTIEFTAFDHYGTPHFSYYKNVLMFVSEYEGKYYQEMYQYYDVYKTKDGRWAGTGFQDGCKTANEKIEFAEHVSYPWIRRDECGHIDTMKFDPSCFKLVGEELIPRSGYYIEELFTIKKETVLKARGLFYEKEKDVLDVKDTELAVVKEGEDEKEYIGKDSLKVLQALEQIMIALQNKNTEKLQTLLVDSIICQPCAIRLFPAHCSEPPVVNVAAKDFIINELPYLDKRNLGRVTRDETREKLNVYFARGTYQGNYEYHNPSGDRDLIVMRLDLRKENRIPYGGRYSFYFTKQNDQFKLRCIYMR